MEELLIKLAEEELDNMQDYVDEGYFNGFYPDLKESWMLVEKVRKWDFSVEHNLIWHYTRITFLYDTNGNRITNRYRIISTSLDKD